VQGNYLRELEENAHGGHVLNSPYSYPLLGNCNCYSKTHLAIIPWIVYLEHSFIDFAYWFPIPDIFEIKVRGVMHPKVLLPSLLAGVE